MKKRYLFIIAIIMIFIFSSLYIYKNEYFDLFNKQFIDLMFKIRGKKPLKDNNIIIVDIDEKSLKKLGQWPWSRNILAKIVDNLKNAGAGIIGFDMVFAEKDRTSPAYIFKKFHINKKAPDYDKIFARAIANAPAILGYAFRFDQEINNSAILSVPAIFIEKNKPKENFLPIAKSVVLNIPILQNSAYSSGFFNTFPDEDGVIRSTPLLIKYKGFIYPSLSLEIIRAILGSNKVIINYSDIGVKNIQIGKLIIPTDRNGRININFYGPKKMFKYISAVDIYNNKFDKNLVNGKIVLLGTSAIGLKDLRTTPFDNDYPGIEVHATILENIINQEFLKKPSWIDGANLTIIILSIIFTIIIFLLPPIFTLIGFIALISGIFLFDYYMFVNKHYIFNIIFPFLAISTTFLVLIIMYYFMEYKQKEKIKEKFAKKVSPQIVEELLKNLDSETFETKEKEITIYFSDIRKFTEITEKLDSPKKLIKLLNEYFTPMAEIIINEEGTIDKFIGDAIMAYWNAPNKVENHADKAIQSSLKQLKKLKELNNQLINENLPEINIGIGINTGIAIVGEMGSKGRSDYTVIGDSVNLASRLESLNKFYGSNIIISEFTYNKLTQEYPIRELDLVRVKGKEKAVKIYEVLLNPLNKNEEKLYMEALNYYKEAKFEKAKNLFLKLLEKNNIKLYKVYLHRCETLIKNPPTNFNGIYEFKTK